MHKDYYEGILQLRNPNKEIIDFVKSQLSKNPKIFIAKEVKVKNGIDTYVSSQKFLRSLAKKLDDTFEGEIKTSRKLHTINKQTGKRVYRVNALFRLPHFKRNQIIEFQGEKVKIMKIGKKVTIKNKKTGKKSMVAFEEIDRAVLFQD